MQKYKSGKAKYFTLNSKLNTAMCWNIFVFPFGISVSEPVKEAGTLSCSPILAANSSQQR
jgi:hypothetical protein